MCECAALFGALPLLLALHPVRGSAALCLWGSAAYAVFILSRREDFSWREVWRGRGWSRRKIGLAALRFGVATLAMIALAIDKVPDRLFAFPTQRPGVWLIVMLLYPLLSALPQEWVFRSFFFRRYAPLFPHKTAMIAASAGAFSFAHILFLNWITPLLSLFAGLFLASSYQKHRSLRDATIEHAFYGDMVFTVGLGVYFVLEHL
jgi:membrane protease YdiL (CAAX protease family)